MAPAPVLTAVWCCSVGTTWPLEVRELDPDTTLGTIVDRISSGVPITQPEPDTLARELLAARGLRLIGDATADHDTRSRRRIGYVCADAEPIAPVADHTITSSDTVTWAGPDGLLPYTPTQRLELTVAHPGPGVCVVTVNGELDLLTAPLLDACVREQLAARPLHLVLNLEPVRFLSARGLTCLQQARDLTQQAPGSQLHLTGLVTRVVARPLEITGLLELFGTYPTLAHALVALDASPSAMSVPHQGVGKLTTPMSGT